MANGGKIRRGALHDRDLSSGPTSPGSWRGIADRVGELDNRTNQTLSIVHKSHPDPEEGYAAGAGGGVNKLAVEFHCGCRL